MTKEELAELRIAAAREGYEKAQEDHRARRTRFDKHNGAVDAFPNPAPTVTLPNGKLYRLRKGVVEYRRARDVWDTATLQAQDILTLGQFLRRNGVTPTRVCK